MDKKTIKKELKELFENWGLESIDIEIEETPDPEMGDYGTPIAFKLASELQKSPETISEEIKEEIEVEGIKRIETKNGYVNFFFNKKKYFNVVKDILESGEEFGSLNLGQGKKAIVEHTSVNPNKPLHIGHGRNSILGDTLSRIMKKAGYTVKVQNYIDDLGLQVAKVLWGYRNLEVEDKKFDHALGDLYVRAHKEIDSENEETRKIVKELEEGSEEGRRLVEKCVEAQMDSTRKLNIKYDLLCWESDIVSSGIFNEVFDEFDDHDNFVKEDSGSNAGCIVMKLGEHFSHMENPDKILIRSDGTATYTAKDIAYQMWKFGLVDSKMKYEGWNNVIEGNINKDLKTTYPDGELEENERSDLVINVVGSEQKYPQEVVALGLKFLGHEKEYENSFHLAYDLARLPDQSFSGREGTWKGYSLDKVLDEAIDKSKEVILDKNPSLNKEKINSVAESVGIGAIRYNILKKSPEKQIVFKWDEALSLEGESSPYIQYAHARCSSILRKTNKEINELEEYEEVNIESQEKELIKMLSEYPEVIKDATQEKRPHLIAHYANDLVNSFNNFYRDCKVLIDDEKIRNWRLALVKSTKAVLKDTLNLMGIEAPEKM